MRSSANITAWHRNYLVLVYTQFWALNLTQYWSYIRSQLFEYLRETLYKHASEHLEAAGPEKKMGNFFFLP